MTGQSQSKRTRSLSVMDFTPPNIRPIRPSDKTTCRKSKVWNYYNEESDQKYVTCTLCCARISRGGLGKKASTSSLKNHLRAKHKAEYDEAFGPQSEEKASLDNKRDEDVIGYEIELEEEDSQDESPVQIDSQSEPVSSCTEPSENINRDPCPSNSSQQAKPEDEYDYFCHSIAIQLRKMPEVDALEMMHKMQFMMMNKRKQLLVNEGHGQQLSGKRKAENQNTASKRSLPSPERVKNVFANESEVLIKLHSRKSNASSCLEDPLTSAQSSQVKQEDASDSDSD